MIKVILGDLIKQAEDFDAIMHGCNCFHGEDSGIAAQMWEAFPMAREMSEAHHDSGDFGALGEYSECVDHIGRFTIINAYTQYKGGANFDIHAFIHILKQINEDYYQHSIAIPMIGCGVGGSDWESVQGAILVYAPDINWTVVVWNG